MSPRKPNPSWVRSMAWFPQAQVLTPLFTQWRVLSGIIKSESHPLGIRVCVSPPLLPSPASPPSPDPWPTKGDPKGCDVSDSEIITESAFQGSCASLGRTKQGPPSLRTTRPPDTWSALGLAAFQHNRSYPPACPAGALGSVWPVPFVGWACQGLYILTLSCSANHAACVTGPRKASTRWAPHLPLQN